MRREKEGTKSRRKLFWVFVPVSLYAILGLWQNLPKARSVPNELIGTWRSSDPRYADRSFEIDNLTINFGTGEGTVTTGFIKKVEAVPEGGRTLYTISYVDDGKEEQCSFHYTAAKEEIIYFKNQPSIPWVKGT
jgi:hypothetical protein